LAAAATNLEWGGDPFERVTRESASIKGGEVSFENRRNLVEEVDQGVGDVSTGGRLRVEVFQVASGRWKKNSNEGKNTRF